MSSWSRTLTQSPSCRIGSQGDTRCQSHRYCSTPKNTQKKLFWHTLESVLPSKPLFSCFPKPNLTILFSQIQSVAYCVDCAWLVNALAGQIWQNCWIENNLNFVRLNYVLNLRKQNKFLSKHKLLPVNLTWLSQVYGKMFNFPIC